MKTFSQLFAVASLAVTVANAAIMHRGNIRHHGFKRQDYGYGGGSYNTPAAPVAAAASVQSSAQVFPSGGQGVGVNIIGGLEATPTVEADAQATVSSVPVSVAADAKSTASAAQISGVGVKVLGFASDSPAETTSTKKSKTTAVVKAKATSSHSTTKKSKPHSSTHHATKSHSTTKTAKKAKSTSSKVESAASLAADATAAAAAPKITGVGVKVIGFEGKV